MKKIKYAALTLILSLFFTASAESVFNSNLSKEDKAKINDGQTVIKNTGNYKKIGINEYNDAAKKTISTIKNLKPAYFAEVFQIVPYEGNEDFLEKFTALIMDIPSYVGIPYYSVQHDKYYDLYSEATIKSEEENGNKTVINADLYMKPFGNIDTKITTIIEDDYFYYEQTNLSTLYYYDKYKCVSPKDMKSIVTVSKVEDNWVLYSVGAVDAPSVFFLKERIETSFMNRIKTFCAHFFKQMDATKASEIEFDKKAESQEIPEDSELPGEE